jgi:hypothetical protein
MGILKNIDGDTLDSEHIASIPEIELLVDTESFRFNT